MYLKRCKDPKGGRVSDLSIPASTCFRVFKLTKILPQSPTHKSQVILTKWWVHRGSYENNKLGFGNQFQAFKRLRSDLFPAILEASKTTL